MPQLYATRRHKGCGVRSLKLSARYPSLCPSCRQPIQVGDSIAWDSTRDGKARHFDCTTAYALAHPKNLPEPATPLPFTLHTHAYRRRLSSA